MEQTAAFLHVPDPEFPGWHTWRLIDDTRFNAHGLGRMMIRRESESIARFRLVEAQRRHSNLQDNVHGGAILALIDVAMFATIFVVANADAAGAVTLDLHNQFIGAGKIGEPLDVVCEVMRETGRLVFLRGTVEQGSHLVASFAGTLRKPSAR